MDGALGLIFFQAKGGQVFFRVCGYARRGIPWQTVPAIGIIAWVDRRYAEGGLFRKISIMPVKVVVCEDSDALAERGADEVVRIAGESVAAHGLFTLALAGGSTPEKMYKLLVGEAYFKKIEWPKVRLFFGDERFVPATDEKQSNYAMVKRSLLTSDEISSAQVFAFDTTLPTVQASALAYEKVLTQQLGEPPVFDLTLLGMGDDGHTASLFPHAGALNAQNRYVVDSPPGILPPPVDRMTATIPVLNASRNVLLLIGGEKKAQALRDVLEGGASVQEHPVASLLKNEGNVLFLIDKAAAGLLSSAVEVSV